MATISSQVIGWVRERFSLPWRALRSRQRLPERGFRKAEDSGAAVFSSSCGDGGVGVGSGSRRSHTHTRRRHAAEDAADSPRCEMFHFQYRNHVCVHVVFFQFFRS